MDFGIYQWSFYTSIRCFYTQHCRKTSLGLSNLLGVEALNGTIGSSNNAMAFADKLATEATSLAQRIRQTLIDMIRYTKLKPLAYSRLV